MKKLLLMALLLIGCSPIFAANSLQPSATSSLMQSEYGNDQIVTAYYVNGNQLCRIIIRISGGFVTGYTFGKDFRGEYEFTFVPNASITRTNDVFDGQLAREYANTSTFQINGRTVKIYF